MEDPEQIILNEDVLKSIRCSVCELYLSISPIFIISQDGKKYKCGRCKVKTFVLCRAFMFEKLVKYMSFPCIYKGCSEIIPFKEVAKHEVDCKYRLFTCVVPDCKKELFREDFIQHIKEIHEKIFYKNTITLKNAHSNFGQCVLEHDQQCYIVLFDYDATDFGFSVSSLEKVNKQFELTISSPESKLMIKIRERKVELFQERYHCYQCIRGLCSINYHEHKHHKKALLKNMRVSLEKEAIIKSFGKSPVIYKLDIVDEKPDTDVDLDDIFLGKEIVIEDDEEDGDNEQEEIILKKQCDMFKKLFECSVQECKGQLIPPIFQCLSGHTLCSECKSKTGVCVICQSKIDSTRNFVLEDIDANLKQERKEEITTSHQTIKCPVPKCTESFKLNDISNHFSEKHTEQILYNVGYVKNVYSHYGVHILVWNEKTYIIEMDFDDANFGVSVYSLGNDYHQYEISLSSEDKKYCISTKQQKISKYDDLDHCFRCLIGVCKAENHPYRKKKHTVFRNMVTKFNRDYIRRLFETNTLNYKIKIVEPKSYIEKDKVLRQALECPICKDYMNQPIHQCLSGHTLCHVCRGRLTKCPTCEAEIKDTLNLALETAVNTAELSCQNVEDQCAYRAILKKLTAHEADCRRNGRVASSRKRQCLEGDIRTS